MRRLSIVVVVLLGGCAGDDGGAEDRLGQRAADIDRLVAGLASVMAHDNPGAHLGSVVFRECGEECACLAPGATVACPDAAGGPPETTARWNAIALAGQYLADQVAHAPAGSADRDALSKAIAAVRIAIPHGYPATTSSPRVSARSIGPQTRYVAIDVDGPMRAGMLAGARFTDQGAVFEAAVDLASDDPIAKAAAHATLVDSGSPRTLALDKMSPAERVRYMAIAQGRPRGAPVAAYETVAVVRPSSANHALVIADPSAPARRVIGLAHESPGGIAIAVQQDGKLRELPLVFVKDHAGPSRPIGIEISTGPDFDAAAARQHVRWMLASRGTTHFDGVDLTIVDATAGDLIEVLDEIALSGAQTVRILTISASQLPTPATQLGGSSSSRSAAIRNIVRKSIAKVTYCYEKELLARPGLEGTVKVTFTIDLTGKVTSSKATGVDPAVASCVANVIKGLTFPPSNTQIQVNYPFVFKTGP